MHTINVVYLNRALCIISVIPENVKEVSLIRMCAKCTTQSTTLALDFLRPVASIFT